MIQGERQTERKREREGDGKAMCANKKSWNGRRNVATARIHIVAVVRVVVRPRRQPAAQ